MISRRGLLGGLMSAFAAPAIVRIDSLMKIPLPKPHFVMLLRGYDEYGDSIVERIPLTEIRNQLLPGLWKVVASIERKEVRWDWMFKDEQGRSSDSFGLSDRRQFLPTAGARFAGVYGAGLGHEGFCPMRDVPKLLDRSRAVQMVRRPDEGTPRRQLHFVLGGAPDLGREREAIGLDPSENGGLPARKDPV